MAPRKVLDIVWMKVCVESCFDRLTSNLRRPPVGFCELYDIFVVCGCITTHGC